MEQNQKLYLFQLIKSLSVSEKGYVKKYCARSGANPSYLQLFDAIDLQETYDEQAIKDKFKSENFIKQLSVAKNYLIKTILRSLRSYHSESNNNIQVHELLVEIELLYHKRQIGLCQKLLKKARRIIEEKQLHQHAQELMFWDFRLTLLLPPNENTEAQIEENKQFSLNQMAAYKQLIEYRYLGYDVFKSSLKEGYTRKDELVDVAHKFSKHPLLTTFPKTTNAKAVGCYYNIWSKLYEITNNFVQGFEASKGYVEIIQKNPKVFEDYLTSTAIPAHYNLLSYCILLNEEETFFSNLEYLKNIPNVYRSKSETIRKLSSYYAINLELQFYTQNAQFHKTPALLDEAIQLVEEGNLVSFGLVLLHIELCYGIAYAYFGLGQYNHSETWVAKTLEYQKGNLREDIMCMAHLLHLVNHTELGSFRYIENKLRSTYNFIKRMQRIRPFEQVMLQFLKKLINSRNRQDRFEILKTYKEKLEVMENEPFDYIIIKNFDIISWLESKIMEKDFATIASERRQIISVFD